MTRAALIVMAIATLALTGCGKVGALERPAPMWGAKAKADYEAQKKAEAAAKAEQDKQGQPESLPADPPASPAPPPPSPPPQ